MDVLAGAAPGAAAAATAPEAAVTPAPALSAASAAERYIVAAERAWGDSAAPGGGAAGARGRDDAALRRSTLADACRAALRAVPACTRAAEVLLGVAWEEAPVEERAQWLAVAVDSPTAAARRGIDAANAGNASEVCDQSCAAGHVTVRMRTHTHTHTCVLSFVVVAHAGSGAAVCCCSDRWHTAVGAVRARAAVRPLGEGVEPAAGRSGALRGYWGGRARPAAHGARRRVDGVRRRTGRGVRSGARRQHLRMFSGALGRGLRGA